MDYTLRQLQIFLKIVQTKSITKASEELFLSQPAVSIQMKNLQEQFEIPLVEVIGRQLYVTDFGKEVAIMAERVLNEVNEISLRKLSYKGILTGKLKISIVSTGKYVMPYFLSGFLKKHPGVELSMDVTNKSKVLESLERNEVDFSLISILPSKLKVKQEIILENKLYLVGNNEIVFRKKQYPNSMFKDLTMIYREDGSATRYVMEEYFRKHKIHVNKKIELTTNEAVKQSVIAGIGYSIMPLIGIRNALFNKDLQIIPISGFPIKSSWRLVWLDGKKLSPLSEAYLKYIRTEKSNVQKKNFSWLNEF